jgi:mercuric ion transport protein
MSGGKLLGLGAAGAVVAGICCATPLLPIVFGALGLSAWLAWSDYVVMPAFLAFGAIAICGFIWRQRALSAGRCATHTTIGEKD